MTWEILIVTIGLVMLCWYGIVKVKKSEEIVEKVIDIVLIVIVVIFLIIYYTDRFNLPTLLGMNKNVDTQNWLTIITTSIASIISSAIGGLIALGIARSEIRENRKQNDEILRIQNMPMLKYEIKIEKMEYEMINEEYLMGTNCNIAKSSIYKLMMHIKNIGLNNVKKIMIDIEFLSLNKEYRIVGDNNLIFIQKDKEIEEYKYLALEKEKECKIKLKVYYQDVLMNWYFQIIDIIYNTNKENNNLIDDEKIICRVNEEKLINDDKL